MKAISKRSVLTYDELDHTSTEVRILKHFAKYEPNNPFIVRLNYAFMDKENIYFVMDFYPGMSFLISGTNEKRLTVGGDLATQMELGRLGHTRTRFYAVDITQGLLDL
jgi:serine/threonine protein kinase